MGSVIELEVKMNPYNLMPEKIIVVYDEISILKSVRRLLYDIDCVIGTAFNGAATLDSLNESAARILAQRQENLDGSGYLLGLKEADICIFAKILSAVADLLLYCQGLIEPSRLSISEALEKL